MTAEEDLWVIGVLASIASIVSAAVAVWQAVQSRRSASKAVTALESIRGRREASDFSRLQIRCDHARRSIEKYGAGSSTGALAGTNQGRDATDVQAFLDELAVNRIYFDGPNGNAADQFSAQISPILATFAQTREPLVLKQLGGQIAQHLNTMASILKQKIDENREAG